MRISFILRNGKYFISHRPWAVEKLKVLSVKESLEAAGGATD